MESESDIKENPEPGSEENYGIIINLSLKKVSGLNPNPDTESEFNLESDINIAPEAALAIASGVIALFLGAIVITAIAFSSLGLE